MRSPFRIVVMVAAALGTGCGSSYVSDDAGTVGDAGRDSGGIPPLPTRIASGPGELVDVFVTEAGIIVVLRDSVGLLSRDGAAVAGWASPREITVAAFDGRRLAIADRAVLTTLNVDDLTPMATTPLTESCAAGVILTGGRFVCGPATDRNRVFYTYDLDAGGEIARSEPAFTERGVPMRAVPGTDAFITVSVGSSRSAFHYYHLAPMGAAVFVGESAWDTEFSATNVYAVVGSPASHVVAHQGTLFRFDGCSPGYA